MVYKEGGAISLFSVSELNTFSYIIILFTLLSSFPALK